jgi:serine/threonine protein phosphatase 1
MTSTPAQIPDNICLYAVGDVHGHKNKLRQLIGMIEQDAAASPEAEKILVFLGDYVDRGPDSKGVVDYLLLSLPAGFTTVFLRGNHEEVAMQILDGETSLIESWMQFGGSACLASYGVNPFRPHILETPEALRQEFAQQVPASHREFFENTVFSFTCGDYFFAHAGVKPDVPLEKQRHEDLMWIRHEFLVSKQDHGKIIVHGHTIEPEPDIQSNRIGIDTGAYATGRLTCLKLVGDKRSFINT